MSPFSLWVVVMAGAYVAGAAASVLAARARASRYLASLGAGLGSAAGFVAAIDVLVSGQPAQVARPDLVAAAGGILIHLDRLGAIFLALVASVGALSSVYGASYTEEYEGRRSLRLFGAMFNLFLLGMSLVSCAGNVFTFLLSWELMALASYFLVMTESEREDTREAGLWYAAMTHLGFVLLLPMFLLMSPGPGWTTFEHLRMGAESLEGGARNAVFLLALVAFGSKAGLLPLHVWLPRAHPAAPSHVSALMSGVMIKLGIYGFLRVTVDFLGVGPVWWGALVLAVGSVSALGGVLYALTENDLKRLLAYSSVENVGVIFLGLGAGLVLWSYNLQAFALAGFGAALLHAVNHAAFKALLFFGAGNVLHRAHTRNMEQMGGLVKGMPHTAALFLVGAAAAAALPPLNGFASEWMIFQALLSGGQVPPPGGAVGTPLAIGVLALTSGLAAACFVKAFGISFLAMPRSEAAAQANEADAWMRGPMLALAVACVVLGLFAPSLLGSLQRVVAEVAAGAPPATPVRAAWLISPGGIAQVSPLLLAALLLAIVAIAVAAVRARGLEVRRADTWGCGRIRQTPRMEYTSTAFAEPLRRVFSELYRPTEDLSISAHPESRYFVRAIRYTTRIVPWFEQVFYDPIVLGMRALATRVRRLQAGSIHLYLLYVTVALLVALSAAWGAR